MIVDVTPSPWCDLLERECVAHVIDTGTIPFHRNEHSKQAQTPHLVERFTRKGVGTIALGGERSQL